MALLFNSLTAINDAYENHDWLAESMQAPPRPDLFDGITTYYDHFEDDNGLRVTRDTDILVEYLDDTDSYAIGTVLEWLDDVTPSIYHERGEWAYIETEQGGRTYAKFEDIIPICEVNENDTNENPLQSLPDAFASTGQATRKHRDTTVLQSILPAIAAWIGLGA